VLFEAGNPVHGKKCTVLAKKSAVGLVGEGEAGREGRGKLLPLKNNHTPAYGYYHQKPQKL